MKKLIILAAVASLGLVSCKKDYTCECKDSNGKVESVKYLDATKRQAKAQCVSYETESDGETYKETCELK